MEIKINLNLKGKKISEITEEISDGETSVSGATSDILKKIIKSLEKEGIKLDKKEKAGLLIKILNGLVSGKKTEITLDVKPTTKKDKIKNERKTKNKKQKPKKDESRKSRDSI